MATKKTNVDPTEQKKAQSAADVENQDAKTRLWQSLDYTYGKKRDQTAKEFAKAYSQADRQALSRGMQRSSYNAQTLANLQKQGIEAQEDIYDAQIADYQNRVDALEQQEKEDERWERQFAEGQRQYNESMGLQREQFEENKANNAWNQGFQQAQADQSQANWQAQFNAGREDAAQSQANWQTSFDYQQKQDAQSQQNWQAQFDASQQAAAQAQQNWQTQFDYQQQQDQQAQANWQAQFDAQQAQQAWQNEYMQDQFKYEYVIPAQQAAAAAQQASAGSSGSSGRQNYTDNRKPWEKMGITEQEYYKLYPNEDPNRKQQDMFEKPSYWTQAANYISNTVSSAK